MEMAVERSQDRTKDVLCEKEQFLHYTLAIEDFLNSIAMMPKDAKIKALVDQFGLTENDAAEAISKLEHHAEASPLMMLQQINSGEGGQFIQFRMGPNYEMALFVAQVTGSVLVTDSGSRWRELVTSQHRNQGIIDYPWSQVLDKLISIPIDYQFLKTFQKSQDQCSAARNFMKSADLMVLNNDRDAAKLTMMADQVKNIIGLIGQATDQIATSALEILCPEGGLYDAHVQRLLARSSCTKYDHQVRSIYGIALTNRDSL